MPTDFTLPTLLDLFKRESENPAIILATLTNPGMETIRVARDMPGEDLTSRGELYTALPFEITLPADNEDDPSVEVSFVNIDRRITENLPNVNGTIEAAFEVVMKNDPDRPIRRYARFKLRNPEWDAIFVTGQLSQVDQGNEPWPNISVTPQIAPALYS